MSLSDDLAIIGKQEQRLKFLAFNEESAWRLGCRLRDMALARSAPLVVEVKRFGQPLFFCALAGSTPDNLDWARRKANVVARFHRSSYGMGLELQQKHTTLADRFGLALADFAAHGGAFPIAVAGSGVIGSVAISGLPQRADHEMVVEALCGELGCEFAELRLPDTYA
ncbi:MAG TPA: heme-degrading domain-containing protein [Bryobacteraceae bacterium]